MTTSTEYEMEEFFSQRTPGKYDIETMKEAEDVLERAEYEDDWYLNV